MKVGILTFHYGSNYGGVLQCYALQQVLKEMGYDVVVINYVPHDGIKKFLFVLLYAIQKRNIMSIKALWHYIKFYKESRKVFKRFREDHLQLTNEECDINKFASYPLDTIVVGSDQVWNFSQQKRDIYFLGWLEDGRTKKVSYAACCGHNVLNEKHRASLIKQLSQFYSISVRSEETKQFVKNVIGQDVPVVADPTFLYDFNEFIHPIEEKYILTYILTEDIEGGNAAAIDVIRQYFPGLPVYSIVISDRQPRLCKWADKQLFDVAPSEWVNLIYNCTFLYTDSFHGTVFSMKFGKPFVAYYSSEGSGRRFVDLQQKFSLQNIVTKVDQIAKAIDLQKTHIVDYSEIISVYVNVSKDYIQDSLKQE